MMYQAFSRSSPYLIPLTHAGFMATCGLPQLQS
jgi:hypothetical protein